jgi:muconolactone delta-isomerase
MAVFLAEIDLINSGSEDFLERIPSQRRLVNELMAEGVLVSYAVAADRKKMWCIVEADNEQDATEILETFPLYLFMETVIHPLLFHNIHAALMGSISLN